MNAEVKLLEELQKKTVELCRRDFYAFVKYIAPLILNEPFVDGEHIKLICEKLQGVAEGKYNRLMIFMPPRSMKSRLGSILFPAWCLGRNPNWDNMIISYERELAMDFSREVRTLVKMEEYQAIFPAVVLRKDVKAVGRWHTTARGVYTVGGIKSGIAGKGATLAMIDDPLSEQDAFSTTKRAVVQRWWPAGLRSRLSPRGRVVLITTRWHDDDLAGWLLKEAAADPEKDQWEVLELPGIIDSKKASVQLNLPVGCSYWPQRWTTEWMMKTKANMPGGQWEALYQQKPIAEGGNILKKKWFKNWKWEDAPHCKYIIQSFDTAHSEKDTADFSAITTWGLFYTSHEPDKGPAVETPNLILLDCWKDRVDFVDLRRRGYKKFERFKPDTMLVEDKASGQSLIQEFRRAGLPVLAFKPGNDRDKVARAYACQPILEAGRVWVPMHMKWAQDFLDELSAFPNARHDDLVDTFSQVVLWTRDTMRLYGGGDWRFGLQDEVPSKSKTYWNALA